MPKYTSEGDIEKYLGVDISGLGVWVETICDAVDKWIERYTNKEFTNDTTETRYFDGDGRNEIIIDSFTTLNTCKILDVDGSTLYTLTEGISDDFVTHPYNATEKNRLIMTDNSTAGVWYRGLKNIEVNATWGVDTSVPEDVKMAATMIASQFVSNALKGGRELAGARLGELQLNFAKIDEEAQAMGIYNILDQYRDIEL